MNPEAAPFEGTSPSPAFAEELTSMEPTEPDSRPGPTPSTGQSPQHQVPPPSAPNLVEEPPVGVSQIHTSQPLESQKGQELLDQLGDLSASDPDSKREEESNEPPTEGPSGDSINATIPASQEGSTGDPQASKFRKWWEEMKHGVDRNKAMKKLKAMLSQSPSEEALAHQEGKESAEGFGSDPAESHELLA